METTISQQVQEILVVEGDQMVRFFLLELIHWIQISYLMLVLYIYD
jgi:hypothetical protein